MEPPNQTKQTKKTGEKTLDIIDINIIIKPTSSIYVD